MLTNDTKHSQSALTSPVKDRVTVAIRHGEYCLVASSSIEPGERIILIDGELSRVACRLSVQVDQDLHISPPAGLEDGTERDIYQWRFLNHSCRPNAVIVRRVLIAIKPIEAGEEVSFDYNTTESVMASPFICRCGHCDSVEISGYRFLTPDEQARRKHLVEGYLCAAIEDA